MKSPLLSGPWVSFDEVDSTQSMAEKWLRGEIAEPLPGVIYAHNQTHGRGRFERTWLSAPDDSMTMSLIFAPYANHPKPWLVGMAVSLVVAGVIHSRVQWPNDLVIERRKVCGILSGLVQSPALGLVPVVGIGVNVNQTKFAPEIAGFATSLATEHGGTYSPEAIAHQIVERLADVPEPDSWDALAPVWALFDDTPGKRYKLVGGEEAVAIAVGPDGQLLCAVDGETQTVTAAEALYGLEPARTTPAKGKA